MPNKPIRFMTKRRVNQIIQEEIQAARNIQDLNIIEREIESSQTGVHSIPSVLTADNISRDEEIENNFESSLQNSDHSNHDLNEQMEQVTENDETLRIKAIEYVKFHEEVGSDSSTTLSEDLRYWFSENSISQQAANKLINIFRNHGHENELKKDVRTLMKTPRDATGKIINGNGGSYFHFGIANGLIRSLNKYYNVCPETILIQLNCDGMSFSKSSSSQFWPVLAAIQDNFYTEPFLVGLFHGNSKPNDFNVYINPFVDEMKILQNNGLNMNDKTINVRLNAIICDAPARAYLTLTKSHSGYFGCSKCIQQGEWKSYVNFPEINSMLRTDHSFKNQLQEEHHLGESLLLELDFGMVSQIPLDYQHLVCLGVTKRYLLRLANGSKAHRLNNDKKKSLNEALIAIKTCIPSEFARQPRQLDSVAKWKATECRQFLLYTGPILLKNILRPRYYNHFMALSVAIRILCDPRRYLVYNEYADELLRWFVEEHKNLYGSSSISYNVHNLVHLAKDCKKFGPLDDFSTFKFENFMSNIKNKVKDAPKPLEQVVNRVHEEDALPIKKHIVPSYPVIKKFDNGKINFLEFKGFTLNSKKNENCCLLSNNNILLINQINYINDQVTIEGEYFSKFDSLFKKPCDSRELNIYLVRKRMNPKLITITTDLVKSKCLYFQIINSEYFVTVPLLQYNN